MDKSDAGSGLTLLLSREMSHFLLRLQSSESFDSGKVRAKMLNYGTPFTAPFLVFDRILVDPSVGSFVSPLYPRIEDNPCFKRLKTAGGVEFADVSEEVYTSVVHEAVQLAERLLKTKGYHFPEAMQADYLLETPLYLFFKESEPFVRLVDSSLRLSAASIQEIAFVFSSFYSAVLSERLNIPMLASRVGASLLNQVPTLLFRQAKNSERTKLFDYITRETLAVKRIEVSVPDMTSVVEDLGDYNTFLEKVIELRSHRGAQDLRHHLAILMERLVEEPTDQDLVESARTAVASATEEIIAGRRSSRTSYVKQTLLSTIITFPFSLVLGAIGGLAAQLGLEEIQYRLSRQHPHWYYFVFQNAPFTKLSH